MAVGCLAASCRAGCERERAGGVGTGVFFFFPVNFLSLFGRKTNVGLGRGGGGGGGGRLGLETLGLASGETHPEISHSPTDADFSLQSVAAFLAARPLCAAALGFRYRKRTERERERERAFLPSPGDANSCPSPHPPPSSSPEPLLPSWSVPLFIILAISILLLPLRQSTPPPPPRPPLGFQPFLVERLKANDFSHCQGFVSRGLSSRQLPSQQTQQQLGRLFPTFPHIYGL